MPNRCYGLGLLMILAGCTQVGPDFEKPQDPWLDSWNTPLLEQAGRFAPAPDLQQWWRVFGDPTLEGLIAEADANNTNLRVAGLRIAEARAQLAIVQTGRYPQLQQLNAQSLYLKQDQSGTSTARDSVFWQSSVGFDIGWEIDFWGRFSRAIESADAVYFASQANYADAMLLMRAQVADTYFALRTAEARLDIAQENAKRQERSLQITERLFRHGENDELDWQQARSYPVPGDPGHHSRVREPAQRLAQRALFAARPATGPAARAAGAPRAVAAAGPRGAAGRAGQPAAAAPGHPRR